MPKLRKHRPDALRSSPPPPTTSSAPDNPWTPRPPSLLSTGSRASAAPVALKSVAPVVAVAEVQASGKGDEAVCTAGGGVSEWETAVRQQGSPSASNSTSPARSSHRRIVSTSTIATVSSHTSLEPIPSSPSISALAKLRESLDADQHAKEAKKVEEVQVRRVRSHAGGKLRKKLPRDRVERFVAAEDEEEERHQQQGEEGAKEEEEAESECVAAPPLQGLRVGEALVFETQVSTDEMRSDETGREGGLDAIPPVASQLPPPPAASSAAPMAAHPYFTLALVSLAFAPARLGWRVARLPFDVASFAASTSLNLAASTVALGTDVAAKTIDTSLRLATNVPVVGLVAAKVPRLREASSPADEAQEEASAPPTSHLPPLTPPVDHFDAALAASDPSPPRPTEPQHPVLETVTKPLSLVRSGVEISLGLGLAGALVAGAVGEFVWSSVRGERMDGKEENREGVSGAQEAQ
ncbi:hypothetical protein Rt10032_c15g5514 [Rhodotorula toruloides]|uniref:Uncharacterized protein n=1 Tax=Rhodotorula toruloides TaxID=5286 RepID=A0A511KMD4_RHOTO|nr:hypothetical protein Rt10032_c15g5514 [Rhodotorula toruloides]